MSTGKSSVQWFVECDAFTNESIEQELASRGLGHDAISRYADMAGSDGKLHDVLLIPSTFVKKLKSVGSNDKRFQFRFWKRNGSKGIISPADFVERKFCSSKSLCALAKQLLTLSSEKKRSRRR